MKRFGFCLRVQVLFLDESGDHNLLKIDPLYPMFVLGGVIMDAAFAKHELPAMLSELKIKLFGTDQIILHTADMARNRKAFARMKDPIFRQAVFETINSLMESLPIKVVACVIDKVAYVAKYRDAAIDPYAYSLKLLVERFCLEVGETKDGGVIVAERRSPILDSELRKQWERLKVFGTDYISSSAINHRIKGMYLRAKTDGISGMEIADLVVSPIGRHVMGKKTHRDYEIVESKFRRNREGKHLGFGLIILP